MSDASQPRLEPGHEAEGKPAALIAWALYILSIPSANVLVLVGLVVAYAARGSATGLPRQHIEAQIALFWSVFWWTIALWVLIAISMAASIILIGIPFLLLFGGLWFLLSIWFTVKSILGVVNLMSDKPA
ncbi:MAG: hypothetical protein B7Y86_01225 [Brevundimonas subvibrioides]|uniref:Transmembrane protein n=1 Tax=Brevundimonas subvibrioides TaxID=74313 RepID=A0A258HPZ6_9CAUL|nr:hypothetical protein [Brevundimonas subvibrioides]OYX59080.1 MAG: hypothetical protein B7Y86_01225 [Brevundimonas subvibrioides]